MRNGIARLLLANSLRIPKPRRILPLYTTRQRLFHDNETKLDNQTIQFKCIGWGQTGEGDENPSHHVAGLNTARGYMRSKVAMGDPVVTCT